MNGRKARSGQAVEGPGDRHLVVARRGLVRRGRIVANVELRGANKPDQMDETRQHARGPRAPAETEEIDAVAFFPILDEKAVGPQNIVIEPVPHCETKNAEELLFRSEERRVGKECVSTCRYRWSQYD